MFLALVLVHTLASPLPLLEDEVLLGAMDVDVRNLVVEPSPVPVARFMCDTTAYYFARGVRLFDDEAQNICASWGADNSFQCRTTLVQLENDDGVRRSFTCKWAGDGVCALDQECKEQVVHDATERMYDVFGAGGVVHSATPTQEEEEVVRLYDATERIYANSLEMQTMVQEMSRMFEEWERIFEDMTWERSVTSHETGYETHHAVLLSCGILASGVVLLVLARAV